MRILGCDLSTTETGWVLVDGTQIIKVGVIKPPYSLTTEDKSTYVVEELAKLIMKENVEELVIENIFFARGRVQAFLILAELRGACCYAWHKLKLRQPISYSTTAARKLAGIKAAPRNLSHKQRKEYIAKQVIKKYKVKTNNHNICDAACLVVAYLKDTKQWKS